MKSTRLVATLIAPAGAVISGAQIAAVTQSIVASGGIVESSALTSDHRAADIFFSGAGPVQSAGPFDILVQPAATRRKKLLIADMESTIIEQEMLDRLAARIGMGARVADITSRAMNGELDFAAALTERVALLKGQKLGLLDEAAAEMTLMPGAEALLAAMKQAGAQCWLVSGGFGFFVRIIAQRLGFHKYFANELKHEDGMLTGDVVMPILDKNAKKNLLEKACADYGYSLAESLAVGDGANDVPMLQACATGGGLGVAYHAKPKVRELIHSQINHGDLSALIYAQGLQP